MQYPVATNVQKKDANLSLERRLASDVLAEMVEIFKGCTIQLDKHVDARSCLRNDSSEQVDAISDSKKLVVDGSDPKSDLRVATHTTNGISATHTTNRIPTQKLLINPTIQVLVGLITPLVTASVVGTRESLRPR